MPAGTLLSQLGPARLCAVPVALALIQTPVPPRRSRGSRNEPQPGVRRGEVEENVPLQRVLGGGGPGPPRRATAGTVHAHSAADTQRRKPLPSLRGCPPLCTSSAEKAWGSGSQHWRWSLCPTAEAPSLARMKTALQQRVLGTQNLPEAVAPCDRRFLAGGFLPPSAGPESATQAERCRWRPGRAGASQARPLPRPLQPPQ